MMRNMIRLFRLGGPMPLQKTPLILQRVPRGQISRAGIIAGIGLLLAPGMVAAQEPVVVEGRVLDGRNGAPLAGVTIAVGDDEPGTISDASGSFVVRGGSRSGTIELHFERAGYARHSERVEVGSGETVELEVRLPPVPIELGGVTAIGERPAERAMRDVRQSPFAVTVIDGARLANRGLTLDEAVQRVAGVQVRRSGGLGSASVFNIRGLEGKRVQVYINGNSVNILGDSFSLDDIPLILVDRVEVYKGIVPARFGGDGLGAAINVVMIDPEEGYDDIGYSWGTHGEHRLSSVVIRTFGSGFTAGLSVNLDRAANDYMMESPFIPGLRIRRDHDRFRRMLVGGVLQYDGGWFDEVRGEGAVIGSNREIQGIQTNVQHAESGTMAGAAVLEADREGALDGRLDVHLGLVAFSSTDALVDTSLVRYPFDGEPYPSPNGRGELGLLPTYSDNRTSTFRHRGTMTYRFSPTHTANLTYTLDHARYNPSDTLANRYAGRNVSEFPGRQSSAVLGLSHEWRPGNGRFLNVVGARGYAFRSEGTPSNIFNPTAERPPPVHNRSTSIGASQAARFFFTPELLAKGSIELARRLPTSNELFGDGMLIQPTPALRPEESLNLNLGFQFERRTAGGRQVQFEAGVFRMDLRDMIRLAPTGFAGAAGHSNLGQALISGIDVELKGDVASWLHASTALTYQDARDALRLTPGTSVPNPTHGLRLPNMPWLFGSTFLEAHKNDLFGALQRSRLFHEISYTEEYFYAFEMSRNQERRIPRGLTHTTGVEHQWVSSGLTVSAEVQNLTDARILNQFNHPLPGRTFRATLRYTRVLDSRTPGIEIQSGDNP